jgi:hypothetical protein
MKTKLKTAASVVLFVVMVIGLSGCMISDIFNPVSAEVEGYWYYDYDGTVTAFLDGVMYEDETEIGSYTLSENQIDIHIMETSMYSEGDYKYTWEVIDDVLYLVDSDGYELEFYRVSDFGMTP